MSFAAEMKDFIAGYKAVDDAWDRAANRRLKNAQADYWSRKDQPPTEDQLNAEVGFEAGNAKVGEGGGGGSDDNDETDPLGYRRGITSIESGGNYSALGPVTDKGDRAYGKYQIMGANIPQWTKEALGTAMTPEQFLKDKDAQNRTFDHRFGMYADKYGALGAAQAWLGGEGSIGKTERTDQLGTSVGKYGDMFQATLKKLGKLGDNTATASASPAIPTPSSTASAEPEPDADESGGPSDDDQDDSGGDTGGGQEVGAINFEPVQVARVEAPAIPAPGQSAFTSNASSGWGAPEEEEDNALFAAKGGVVPEDDSWLPDWLQPEPPIQSSREQYQSDHDALVRRQALSRDRAPRDDAFEPPAPESRAQQVSRGTKAPGRMAGQDRYRPTPSDRPSKDDQEPMAPKGRRPQTGRAPGRMAGEDRYIPDEADRELPTYDRPVQGPPSPPRAPAIPPRGAPRRDVSAEPARRADEAAAERRRTPPEPGVDERTSVEDRRRRQLQQITGGPRQPPVGREEATPAIPERSPSPWDPTLGQQVRDVTAGPRNPPTAPDQPLRPGEPDREVYNLRDQTSGPRNPPVAPEIEAAAAPQQGPPRPDQAQPTAPEIRRRTGDSAIPGRLAGEDRYVKGDGQVGLGEAIGKGVEDTYSGVKDWLKRAYTSPQPEEEGSDVTAMGDMGGRGGTSTAEPVPPPDTSGSAAASPAPTDTDYPPPPDDVPIPTKRPEPGGAIPVPGQKARPSGATSAPPAPTRTPQPQRRAAPAPAPRRGEPQPEWGQRSTPSNTAMRGDRPPTVGEWMSGRQSNPRTVGVGKQAIHSGLGYLARTFGFGQGAVPGRDNTANETRFAQGYGASTPEEIQGIDGVIDPDGQMGNADRVINRYAQTYQYYMRRGMKQQAQMAAAGLLQYGGQQVSRFGNLAAASMKQYQQTQDPRHLQQTLNFLNKAYEYIPDGSTFDVHIDPQSHQIVATQVDQEGNRTDMPVAPQDLAGFVKGAMDKSLYWQSIYQIADPAGARNAMTRKAADERAATNRQASDARQQRGFEHTDKNREADKAAKSTEAKFKVLTKARPLINTYKRAEAAAAADPSKANQATLDEAKIALEDNMIKFDKKSGKYWANVNGKWVVAE